MGNKQRPKKSGLFDVQGGVDQEQKDQEIVKACAVEVEAVLKKHNCQMSVTRRMMYGQTVFVPVIENISKT